MNTCDRIKQLFEDNNVTAYEVSVRTHISQSTLSRILNNKTDKLSIKTTDILSDYFSVRREWLVTGKGEKFVVEKFATDITNNELLISLTSNDAFKNYGIEEMRVMVRELKTLNAKLIEENRILNLTNESLATSIKDIAKESLIKTELLKTLSEGSTIKNGLDKVG
jgi:transcriptional regulator with XRE-family HTH domain